MMSILTKRQGSETRDGRIAGSGIVAKLPLSDKNFHKMIDSGELRHHNSPPFKPQSIMTSTSYAHFSTHRTPAIAGAVSCLVAAIGTDPRPTRFASCGTVIVESTVGYSWHLGKRNIREGRQMA
jgi:hypothetical protein